MTMIWPPSPRRVVRDVERLGCMVTSRSEPGWMVVMVVSDKGCIRRDRVARVRSGGQLYSTDSWELA